MSCIATPTKLRDGSWGARVPGAATPGQTVTIKARSGKTWQARVERVVWTAEDDSVSIAATVGVNPPPRSRAKARRSDESCGYPCPVSGRRCTPDDLCHDCQ